MTDDERILEIARRRGYYRPRCLHEHNTLCQHYDAKIGWFATWQCDDCGLTLDKAVTSAQLEDGQNLPDLDVGMAMQAIDSLCGGDIRKTVLFFSRAMGRRNGRTWR